MKLPSATTVVQPFLVLCVNIGCGLNRYVSNRNSEAWSMHQLIDVLYCTIVSCSLNTAIRYLCTLCPFRSLKVDTRKSLMQLSLDHRINRERGKL